MTPEERLEAMGIRLPAVPEPLGSYIPAVRAGRLVFLSGMLPLREGKLQRKGRVGEAVRLEDAKEEAKAAAVNALSALKAHIGSLDKVLRCVRLCGYVASAPDFTEQPKVLNAASDFLRDVFGDAGRHVRSAVGVSVLPMDSPVEIDFVFEVED